MEHVLKICRMSRKWYKRVKLREETYCKNVRVDSSAGLCTGSPEEHFSVG